MNPITAARLAVYIGRIFFTLALLALIGAWITQLFLAALMLLTYREPPGAYKTKSSGQPGPPRLFAPKTLTVHFTFTQEELQCDEL